MPLIIPTPERKKRLQAIHKHLGDFKFNGAGDSLAKAVKLMLQDEDFQKWVQANPSICENLKTASDLQGIAWQFLYMFLYARDYVGAAFILWGDKTFTPEPKAAQLIWGGLFDHSLINVMGCGSVGKTFSPSAWMLLDWVLDPEWTRVQVVSNSEDHVRKNLFGDMVRLHGESVIDLPGKVDTESISLDKKRAMGIFTLTIPGGPTSRGKLKGSKMKNRPPHPLFGDNSRLRAILDEAQEIPANIFDEIPNLLSSIDGTSEHIKILAAANPKDEWSRYGQNCKPIGGWDKIGPLQETWDSETGWHVISINAMQTENVLLKRTVFPRMITYEGVQKIIKSQGGGNDQHPLVYTYVYGRFPPNGSLTAIIQSPHLRRAEGDWIFESIALNFASFDPAFTGDLPAMAVGRVGRAVGWMDYGGVRHDLPEVSMKIQVDGVGILPRGDTQDLADEVMTRLKQLNVAEGHFAIDKTGPGIGVHDVVRRQWALKVGPVTENGVANICGVNYSESPTEMKISEEDTVTPKEAYDRICSELWFAGGKLFEYDCIRLGRGVDAKTFEELAARRGGSTPGLGKKQAVEGKDKYKSRTGEASPDRADAVLLLCHVARISTPGLVPKARDTEEMKEARQAAGEWAGFDQAFGSSNLSGIDEGLNATSDMMKD